MKLSIVTSLYHSGPYIEEFHRRVSAAAAAITADYEIVLVNDGSPDDALGKALALQQRDARVVVVDLSRNFGHHRALMTGLQHARGDHVFLADIDLEEPPEALATLWSALEAEPGLDVAYGVQKERKGDWFERWSGRLFYRLFALISDIDYPADTLVARVMTRRYVDAILRYPERELELWGIFVLAGFAQKPVAITKGHKGTTTYTFRRKLSVALQSVVSFSTRPLLYISFLGFLMTAVMSIMAVTIIWRKIFQGIDVEGWVSLIVSIWLVGALILFSVGIIGVYLGKMFLELKDRPLTVVRHVYRRDDERA